MEEYILDESSLSQVLDAVDEKTGRVNLSLPSIPDSSSYYRLFAFYEKLSGHKNVEFEYSQHETIF